MLKVYRKLNLGLVLAISVVSLSSNNGVVRAEEESTSLYDSYNLDRSQKSAVENLARQTEVNAILATTGLVSWDRSSTESEKLGNFESVEKLFEVLGEDLNEHKIFYKKYKENEIKRIEEQEDLRLIEPIDYLAVSDVKINYYFDNIQKQLSQVIEVTSEEKVYRCIVIYDSEGNLVNYLEV